MPSIGEIKDKVQRLLTSEFGSVRIDKDGDFVVIHNSAVVFVGVAEGAMDADTMVHFTCPMVTSVPQSNELYRWVATDGQKFKLGSVAVWERDDGVWLAFRYSVVGDDIDPSELFNSLKAVALTGDRLDNELQQRFGGKIYGRE